MPKIFEWYYFDIHTDDGFDVIFTLHTKPFMSSFEISIFDFFVYKNNKQLHHFFYNLPQLQLNEDTVEQRISFDENNYILQDGKKIKVNCAFTDINLELDLTQLAPLETPIVMDLLPDSSNDKYFKWKVFAPYAQSKGVLKYKNTEFNLNGIAYHDYNTGNITFNKELKRWFWGKFYLNDSIVVLGDICSRKSGNIKVQITATKDNISVSNDATFERVEQNIKSEYLSFRHSNFYKLDEIPIRITSAGNAVTLFMAKLIEAGLFILSGNKFTKFIPKLFSNTSYRRFRLQGENDQKETVTSFYEEIEFH